jgi:toxin CcdB
MARLDVYANPVASERKLTPYFVDVQAKNLHPLLKFNGEAVVLDTSALGAVPGSELRKLVGHLRDERPQIQEALDALFGAY